MKRFFLTAVVAATTCSGLSGLSQAATRFEPNATGICRLDDSLQSHFHEYHVMYFDCSCGHWKCYGVYDSRCEAKSIAGKLADAGYKVRIDAE